jgi:hypothetical protein
MVQAVEHIRRMRGGAQSHLMRCRGASGEDEYYVVKFRNNPQHPRILVNELLGTELARAMGLPATQTAIVEVPREIIELTAELRIEYGAGATPCLPGFQFGSRYPCDPGEAAIFDFLPDEQLDDVQNLPDFLGMLVFDKWTCNTNGRQAIFLRLPGRSRYSAMMIDQGFCFGAGEWNFPDAPLRGLYFRQRVYLNARGMSSFEPWLSRAAEFQPSRLDEILKLIPPEWHGGEFAALERLAEKLLARRKRLPELIVQAKKSYRQPFPNWT